MMKMGAHILSKIPYTVLFMKRSTKNQIWNPINIAAVIQFNILTIRSQVFIYIFCSFFINVMSIMTMLLLFIRIIIYKYLIKIH